MAEAYVLVNCDLGAEEEIISGLKQIEQVKEVHGTFGAYDIIAKVQQSQPISLGKPSRGRLGRWLKYVQP